MGLSQNANCRLGQVFFYVPRKSDKTAIECGNPKSMDSFQIYWVYLVPCGPILMDVFSCWKKI